MRSWSLVGALVLVACGDSAHDGAAGNEVGEPEQPSSSEGQAGGAAVPDLAAQAGAGEAGSAAELVDETDDAPTVEAGSAAPAGAGGAGGSADAGSMAQLGGSGGSSGSSEPAAGTGGSAAQEGPHVDCRVRDSQGTVRSYSCETNPLTWYSGGTTPYSCNPDWPPDNFTRPDCQTGERCIVAQRGGGYLGEGTCGADPPAGTAGTGGTGGTGGTAAPKPQCQCMTLVSGQIAYIVPRDWCWAQADDPPNASGYSGTKTSSCRATLEAQTQGVDAVRQECCQ